MREQLARRGTPPLRLAILWIALGLLSALSGCKGEETSVPDRPAVRAFTEHKSTVVGSRIAELAAGHPDESGFAIIRYGQPALAARLALADLAERSLDIQYYIWEADPTGRILADRLVRAAERGVRVRILVDDINTAGRDDRIAALDAHPNISIRIFNPFASRRFRVFDFATDLARVNHRMHNKTMITDNAVALVGGRNVGAHYFEAHSESNFRDLDIVGVGPIVRETSDVFDRFWNGPWSVPAAEVVDKPATEGDFRAAVEDMRRLMKEDAYPFPVDTDVESLMGRLEEIFADLVWAPAQVVWEDPSSIFENRKPGRMDSALYERMRSLESEILIESAYFVPRDRGVEAARSLVERGVKVRILTNSLAANDVLAAHAGYSKYRRPMLEAGVELYELRPYPGPVDKKVISAGSKAGLHTKAIVFDREAVFIGSFNLDPRSAAINTEAGIYVESPELSQQVIDYMNEGVAPENAFRVVLDDNDDLRWIIESDGVRLQYETDPNSKWHQRWLAGFIRLLPVERQL
jgi:putative cardiolipin synthase